MARHTCHYSPPPPECGQQPIDLRTAAHAAVVPQVIIIMVGVWVDVGVMGGVLWVVMVYAGRCSRIAVRMLGVCLLLLLH